MNNKNIPLPLQFGFKEIEKSFPHLFKSELPVFKFKKISEKQRQLSITLENGIACIEYTETVDAFRGFMLFCSFQGNNKKGFQPINEYCPHKMNGSMLDVSRNGVYTIDALKKIIVMHALLGLNMLMLYTEDTFEVADEPFFGYMRGRYTTKELKEVDLFASKLGIEMIPCI